MGPDGDGIFQTPVRFGAGAYLTSCRGPGTICRGAWEELGISSLFLLGIGKMNLYQFPKIRETTG